MRRPAVGVFSVEILWDRREEISRPFGSESPRNWNRIVKRFTIASGRLVTTVSVFRSSVLSGRHYRRSVVRSCPYAQSSTRFKYVNRIRAPPPFIVQFFRSGKTTRRLISLCLAGGLDAVIIYYGSRSWSTLSRVRAIFVGRFSGFRDRFDNRSDTDDNFAADVPWTRAVKTSSSSSNAFVIQIATKKNNRTVIQTPTAL